MVLKLNSLSKSLSKKRMKGLQGEGKQQSGGARHKDSRSVSKNGTDSSSEIQVAARPTEPMVTFRYVNGIRIALDPASHDDRFGDGLGVNAGGVDSFDNGLGTDTGVVDSSGGSGSPDRTDSTGDPTGSDSDVTQEPVVARVNTTKPIQTIIEGGASVWEVRTLWLLKRCARYKNDVSMAVTRMSASKVLMACVALAVVGFIGFRTWQGPQRNVNVFLRSIGMGDYFNDFLEHRYNLLEDIINITEEADLVKIGVKYKAERQRLLRHAEALRTQRSIALAALWGLFCFSCVISVVVLGCVLVFPGARNRVGCCLLWCGFMAWYKLRLWYRLWNIIDIECKPRLEWTAPAPPRTPDSTVNPPCEIFSAGSAPVTTRANVVLG